TLQCNSVPGGSTTAGCQSVPDIRIAQGFPQQLAPPTTQPSLLLGQGPQLLNSAPTLAVFDQNLNMPTVHEWNFSVQRELPGGTIAELGYVGKRGLRLFRAYDINQIDAGPILPSFVIMKQNVARNCNADGTSCPAGVTGQTVPLVTSGIVNSA